MYRRTNEARRELECTVTCARAGGDKYVLEAEIERRGGKTKAEIGTENEVGWEGYNGLGACGA